MPFHLALFSLGIIWKPRPFVVLSTFLECVGESGSASCEITKYNFTNMCGPDVSSSMHSQVKWLVFRFIAAITCYLQIEPFAGGLTEGKFSTRMTNMGAITVLCMGGLQPVVLSLANTAVFLLGSRYISNCENVIWGLGIVLSPLSVWPSVQLHNLVATLWVTDFCPFLQCLSLLRG